MESPISDIFTTFVFNNIMEVTFISPPRVFSPPCHQEIDNSFKFNDIYLWKFLPLNS